MKIEIHWKMMCFVLIVACVLTVSGKPKITGKIKLEVLLNFNGNKITASLHPIGDLTVGSTTGGTADGTDGGTGDGTDGGTGDGTTGGTGDGTDGGTVGHHAGSSTVGGTFRSRPTVGEWGAWTRYSGCSMTCGGGTRARTRIRTCHGDGKCSQPLSESQTVDCNTGVCKDSINLKQLGTLLTTTDQLLHEVLEDMDKNISRYTELGSNYIKSAHQLIDKMLLKFKKGSNKFSSSHQLNEGQREHNFQGSNKFPSSHHRNHGQWDNHHQDSWSSWTNYSACTKTCGGGIQVRTRSKKCRPERKCKGPLSNSQTSDCNMQRCVEWSAWTEYSACTKTCGGGTKIRTRTKNCHGGRYCETPHSDSQTHDCNTENCDDEPGYSEWSEWTGYSGCTRTCGGGIMVNARSRSCQTGTVCNGPATESHSAICNKTTCPGVSDESSRLIWSSWSTYSACTTSCGGGIRVRTRSRKCTNNICKHPTEETQPVHCSKHSCPGM